MRVSETEAPTVGGDTKLCFIIGDPIAQVKSPAQFNPVFAREGIDAIMLPMHVTPADLASAMEGLRAMRNLAGVVITVPHKEAALSYCALVSARAAAIGAANVMRLTRRGWEGDNFDGFGFAAGVAARGFRLTGSTAFMAGTGGAGRSVAFALAESGVSRLALWDTDSARLENVARNLHKHHPGVSLQQRPAPVPDDLLVVNCTPLGMSPHDPLPFDVQGLHPGQLVADIIMHPETTRLLEAARERGCDTHPGKWMLHHQVEAMIRFFGLAPGAASTSPLDG